MKTPNSLDDLRLFWVVAHPGRLTAATTQLAMPVSTLSRQRSSGLCRWCP